MVQIQFLVAHISAHISMLIYCTVCMILVEGGGGPHQDFFLAEG